jgi:TrmH family RNA methyltransferase
LTGAQELGVLAEPISSVDNALVKRAAALRVRKYRKLHRAFLVEGADLVVAGVRCGHSPQAVFVLQGTPAAEDLPRGGAFEGLPVALITRRVAERITTLETPPEVSAVFPVPDPPSLAGVVTASSLIVYADHVADPGNLGTLLRAAAAFGAAALITSPDSADHLAPKVVRASMGAIFALPVRAGLPLADVRAALGDVRIYGLAAHGGTDLRSGDVRRPAVLCVGAERAGLAAQTAALADELLTIPLAGGKPDGVESLNAGVAGAIALYELACRRAPSRQSHRDQTER